MKKTFLLTCMALMAVVSAVADLPFRNARWDSFHSLKPNEGDIVFVGNSITNMHQWWEAFGGQNKILNRGTSGGFTTEVLPNLETIIIGHPAKVFIGIGTNDICEQPSLEITADNIRIIAERIRRESPNTEVYIQSLIPSTHNGSGDGVTKGRGQRIPQINALLKTKAEALNEKYGKVKFLNVFSQLVATDGVSLKKGYNNQSLAFDNLHPTALGYKLWCDYISSEVGYSCVYKEQQMVGGMSNNNAFGDCLTAFEQFKVKASDILMVGGDMIHNGEWHEFMKSEDFKNRGLGWGLYSININQLATIIDRAMAAPGSVAPKAVVLYAGDWNSNQSQSAAEQMTLYKAALKTVKEKCAGSKVFVLSTMPNNDNNKNNIVVALNNSLKEYAAEGGYTFVDAYSEIAKDKQTYMNGTNYVYTKGYAKIAQVLAASINEQLKTNYTALTDAEANANVEMYNARKELGDALTNALRLTKTENIGSGIGQYSASALTEIEKVIAEACALLASTSATAEAIRTKATELKSVTPTLNPVTAEAVNGKQFYLQTPNRGNRYAVGGNGTIDRADSYNNYSSYRWVFEPRQDGSFDIKNLGTDTYADPTTAYNGHIALTATAPEKGWSFKANDATGTYAIYSEAAEFNMSNNTNMWVYNWYDKNGSYPDLNDTGCQFSITEAEGDPEDPEAETIDKSKVYTIRAIFKSGSAPRYLVNNSGTLAAVNEAPTTEAGYWMVGEDYVMSVADNKYLGVNSGFTLNTNKVTIAISDGLTEGAKTIGEVAGSKVRNGAINSNGNVAGGQFTDGKYNEYSGWSTDMVLERVYPDPSKVSIRLDGTELYFTTTEVKDNDKTTYSLSAKAEPFVLEEVEGGYTIKSAKTEKYAGYGHTNSWDFSNDADTWRIENIEGEPTTIYQLNDSKGFGADKQEEAAGVYTNKSGQKWVIELYKDEPEPEPEPVLNIVVDKEHGNLYRDGSATGSSWNNTWKSNTLPQLVFSASANNMTWSDNNVQIESGQAGSSAYTLTAPAGYIIKNFSFDFAAKTEGKTVKLTTLQQDYTTSTTPQTISREDYGRKSFNFSVTGTNGNSTILTNFVVEIEEGEEPEDLSGYKVFDNASSTVPYRIPAVAKNQNGDLIFVTDYRYSHADIGMANNGKLDLRYRIKSADGTWSEVMTLAKCIESPTFTAFGDPCIVADRESNRVMVTSCCGNVSFPNGNHANHQGWARFYSEDGGKTWGTHTDISEQVFTQLDKRNDGQIRCFFIGSGKISQSSTVKVGDYYRLYCAALVKTSGGTNVNYVFYSDDFGQNWNLLGDVNDCPIPSGADEPKADELPDGSILVSSRVGGGRYFNIYHFTDVKTGAGSWGDCVKSSSSTNGVVASSNACNGEIMIVPVVRAADKVETNLLLQSAPFGPGNRSNVGINYKDLTDKTSYATSTAIAADWTGRYQVSMSTSAYSTMCLDKDGDLAFFYEENNYNDGYDMIYKTISIDELTDGAYSILQKETEGIASVGQTAQRSAATFDLQGRQVQKAQRGLYIENGRKLVR